MKLKSGAYCRIILDQEIWNNKWEMPINRKGDVFAQMLGKFSLVFEILNSLAIHINNEALISAHAFF